MINVKDPGWLFSYKAELVLFALFILSIIAAICKWTYPVISIAVATITFFPLLVAFLGRMFFRVQFEDGSPLKVAVY
jgi:hypothetical protein